MSKRSTSLGTIANVGIDLYQVKKLNNINEDISNLRASVNSDVQNAFATSTALTLTGISHVADLQVGMMTNLRDMDEKLETLSQISWKINSHYERKEKRDQFVGSMRMILHHMKRELDEIETYQDTHTEYAVMKLEIIRDRISQHDVKVEHFALVSNEEMEHAQSVLDRIQSTYRTLMTKLRVS
jgi:hypothetical protein